MNIKWNADEYTEKFDFVHKYGEDVLGLIDAEKGSFAVDLGCGNGALSAKLRDMGYNVLGIDASRDMIGIAQKSYPNIEFITGNALSFALPQKADVIFSNAVFHWIDGDKQDALIHNIAEQLRHGGKLICEFGGKGCAEAVHSSLEISFAKWGLKYPRVFYFPSIGEYAPILERHGLIVEYATLFDRPTEQKTETGLVDWIDMFVKKPFENMDLDIKTAIINDTVSELKDSLYINGRWFIDYVRIRLKAYKI